MELKSFFKVVFIFWAVGFYSIAFSYVTGQSPCPAYGILGVPCPSCGMTRAALYFLRGDVKTAFHYHPLFWYLALIPMLALWAKKLKPSALKKIYISLTAAFCLVWAIRMITLFPNAEPMTLNHSAVIPRIVGMSKMRGKLWDESL